MSGRSDARAVEPVRAWMEGADDAAVASWLADRVRPAPLLWRGIARHLRAGDALWAAAVEGAPLNLSPWSYACFTESIDEAADWAAFTMSDDEREHGLLTVVLLLDGVGHRMTDHDGDLFVEWLVPNDGVIVVAKTRASVSALRYPAFMNAAPVEGVRLITCRWPS